MKIIFPGEAHPAVHLDSAIAHGAAGVARVQFGDGNSSGGVGSVLLESPCRVINCRTSTLRFEIHVGALVLHGLKHANGFAELFARLSIFDGDIERALHSADHFGSESSRGNAARSRQASRFAELLAVYSIELHGVEFASKIHT